MILQSNALIRADISRALVVVPAALGQGMSASVGFQVPLLADNVEKLRNCHFSRGQHTSVQVQSGDPT
jgi:hypothetical protein